MTQNDQISGEQLKKPRIPGLYIFLYHNLRFIMEDVDSVLVSNVKSFGAGGFGGIW